MRALTLWRPWPWAIFHGGVWAKRIENRPWKPWASIIGQRIGLHAGKKFDFDAVELILAKTIRCLEGHEHDPLPVAAHDEGLIGVVTVRGFVSDPWDVAVEAGQGQERWFFGPYGWVLDDVVALGKPISIRGAQGLWELPAWAEQAVRAQLGGGA